MNKQSLYRNKYKEINPKWEESTTIYHNLISNSVTKDTYLLDVGCGHSDLLSDIYSKTQHTYGIDPDLSAINRNAQIRNLSKSFVEKMPFEDNFFDLVVCAWVLEHIRDPEKAFREIYRVLKPQGKVIFLTPNVLNYNVWIIRLIPERFHECIVSKLYNRQEHDTFSKKYKINSPNKINRVLSSIGYKKVNLILNGDPSYISFNLFTFYIALLLEKILDIKIFRNFKVHIIGEYRKV